VTRTAPPYSQFLAPRHWPTWLGIGLLCLAALMPLRLRLWLGARLGDLTFLLGRERRYITRINIDRCFPELNAREREALVRRSFRENGIGLVETACGWIRPASHFKPLARLKGGELIAAALAQGRGVLFLGAHYTTLDFAANLLSQYFPFAVTYRSHKNPLFDAFMLRGRLRNCNGVFDRFDIRGAFRHLKQGKILWYAPDQDYGPEQSVYAPFFGHTAATITAGSRFAAFNRSPTFVVRHHRDHQAQPYDLEAIPFPDFPSGDDVADATRLNQALEAAIRVNPAQYLWMHKRFKTQPGGKPDSPYIYIKTPHRKLSLARYQDLIAGATDVATHRDRQRLTSGLELRRFPGHAKGLTRARHPALRLDAQSKQLRAHGIATVTVDNLFRLPNLHSATVDGSLPLPHQLETVATCFVPAAVERFVGPREAAEFLALLHHGGATFIALDASDLIVTATGLAVDDPLRLRMVKGNMAQADRLADLHRLGNALGYDATQSGALADTYLHDLAPADQQAWRTQLAAMKHSADNGAPSSPEPPSA
jgi:KDO2-lipid IV(A) lauroyltransferase